MALIKFRRLIPFFAAAFFIAGVAAAHEPVNVAALKSFGTMGKQELVLAPDKEAELFQHAGSGCLTHMWFGGAWKGYDATRIRIYVDGESEPSIDMELFLGHGIGFGDQAAPWGTKRIGKTGLPSGVYNNYRVPFGKGVRVTAQLGPGVSGPQDFWWIIQGVDNLPVEIGGMRLPDSARLKLHKVEGRHLAPLEMVDLAKTPNAGILYQVTMAVQSRNLNFLEALMRAYIDGAEQPLYLSSGTEDYFLGTYYFNRGPYHLDQAGLTHINWLKGNFSAYRFHEEDPVVFRKSLRLVWRNGETRPDGSAILFPQPSTLTSYVWIYEWGGN